MRPPALRSVQTESVGLVRFLGLGDFVLVALLGATALPAFLGVLELVGEVGCRLLDALEIVLMLLDALLELLEVLLHVTGQFWHSYLLSLVYWYSLQHFAYYCSSDCANRGIGAVPAAPTPLPYAVPHSSSSEPV